MIAFEEKAELRDAGLEPDLAAVWAALQDEIGQGNLRLPLMPRTVQKVIGMSNDPDIGAAELAAVIQRDQALSGHVLRVANSASFAGKESISSLQQAATRLGMKFVSEAALAISLKSDTFRVKGLEQQAAAIWKHALAAGVYGREIAQVRRRNVECQYLCGLLHTVGKPVGLSLLSELRERKGWDLTNEELTSVSDATHTRLGAQLAREWSLPRPIVHVCQWYRCPKQVNDFEEETAMTYLSSRLADWVIGNDTSTGDELRADGVFQLLNLYPDEVDELLDKREEVGVTVEALNR